MPKQRICYHATTPDTRESIREHGLRPGTWASFGPPAVYLYEVEDYATGYVMDEPMDVWRVDANGLRLEPDPEDPEVSFYSLTPIPPERLSFHGTFLGGELFAGELPGRDDE